jgi:hypothetical protein
MYWTCAQLEPNRTALALYCLGLNGFEVYCPRLREQRRSRGRKIVRTPPLFPGYAFVLVVSGWWNAKWSPELCLLLCCHADASIGDGELDEAAAIAHLACRKLARIAQKIEQYLPQPHGVHGQCAEVLLGVNDEAVLVLLGKLPGGANDVVDQRR